MIGKGVAIKQVGLTGCKNVNKNGTLISGANAGRGNEQRKLSSCRSRVHRLIAPIFKVYDSSESKKPVRSEYESMAHGREKLQKFTALLRHACCLRRGICVLRITVYETESSITTRSVIACILRRDKLNELPGSRIAINRYT